MNYRLIFKVIGNTLRIEALLMLLPLAVSLIYGEGDVYHFLWPILISMSVGMILSHIKSNDMTFRAKDAFAVAGLAWLFISIFGALPFYFSGQFSSIIDCVFESVAGFTTTGSTVLSNIEVLPNGIILWRSLSNWIGGIGVLVFILAVMPSLNASSINLLRAEITGPTPDKIVPKIRETAKIMCLIYLAMTIVLVVLLWVAGLPLFDSLVHALATAGTGGVSSMSASIGAYGNIAVEIILTVFMFLFGISFTLYFFLLDRNFMKIIKDQELKVYLGIVILSIAIITMNIADMYGGFAQALRYSSFQVTSVVSTTCFVIADFSLWPTLSQIILVCLMIIGCCAGSTGGGMKLIRIILLFKMAKIEIGKILHPGSVKPISINGKKVSNETVSKTMLFFLIYFGFFFVSILLIAIEGKDILSTVTSVIASLSNIGSGLGIVGPAGNYASFTAFSKIILSVCMIAGRLEFLPVLVLFMPSIWKRRVVKSAIGH